MKRQERLSLFFEREREAINSFGPKISGLAGFAFTARNWSPLRFEKELKHFFVAAPFGTEAADAVFEEAAWPLPADFFDCIVLDHPLDLGLNLEGLMHEAYRVLRKNGVLMITGFNKTRLCSWPVQTAFATGFGCSVKRYSMLEALSLLDEKGFMTEIRYFDFCRFRLCNKIFARIIPFLGLGAVIIARKQTVDLAPLEGEVFHFAGSKITPVAAQPEYCHKNDPHG